MQLGLLFLQDKVHLLPDELGAADIVVYGENLEFEQVPADELDVVIDVDYPGLRAFFLARRVNDAAILVAYHRHAALVAAWSSKLVCRRT